MIEKYHELLEKSRDFSIKWDGKINDDNLDNFIREAAKLDKFRFETSYEWYEPKTYENTKRFIFENPNPDKGLLLFFLCCWLDLQMDYRIIWSRHLEKASYWIDDPKRFEIPRGSYPATMPNLIKTLNVANSFGSISNWFIETILNIVKDNSKNKGNLYRLAGHIMSDLLEPSKYLSSTISYLKQGNADLLGNWKRLWMLIMFLRRDNNIIKNLLGKAFENKKNGMKALNYWYDKDYFNKNESELPVDIRIKERLPRLWGLGELSEKDVSYKAHEIAKNYKIPPSTFDAIFFGV